MVKTWWKSGVAYQVYVRSFNDSNGDGIGDLQGIIEKLDYLKDLGIDMIYLNPINKSPNYDNGYDISDFRDIMDEFGTLEDIDRLMDELKKRDMKLILDLVLNHSSHEHPWFIESRKSKDNPYRDYYIWHPGKDGQPPCNWGSFFGGSVWQYDETTSEYYFHLFTPEQPDLNWRNENVRREMKEIIRYWLDKGIDGFRLDAINHLEKDFSFADAPVDAKSGYGNAIKYMQNLPEVHNYIKEIKRDVFGDSDCVFIGETGGISYDTAFLYTGLDRKELDMVFHFDLHNLGNGERVWEKREIDLVKDLKKKMSGWQTRPEEDGWCPIFFGNHDSTRALSRLGDDQNYWKESAKMLATVQLTQKGTPFIYYGEEIGMTNAWEYEITDFKDSGVINHYHDLVKNGTLPEEYFLQGLRHGSRDNSRTPMQWDESKNAGFSTSDETWIKVNSNYKRINVAQQLTDPDSILNYYKNLIRLRKEHQVLIYGEFTELNKEDERIYAYIRELEGEGMLVMANFFGQEADFCLPEEAGITEAELLLSNYEVTDSTLDQIKLRPFETRIYKI